MPTLASQLRNKLERAVIEARDVAEVGARAALETLGVNHHEPYPHMKPDQRKLRNHLRARARQLGDRQDTSGRLAIDRLAGECAYEHWHRMLFARFLAENNLLIEPEDNMAISLAEAEELAKEEGLDVWAYASRCAQRMLPQIFRPDDPLLQITLAPEHMLKLETLLASLPAEVFTASDALGWVYQFWQSKKKDEINRSEVKIGANELSAVTQLFTEPYMVEFLLHNTLGAWWAGRKLSTKDAAEAQTEDELRAKLALPSVGWEYLRFVRGADGKGGPWRPAAGTFGGWPQTAAELRVLDPCCGSGHFLVAALHALVPIRMVEEGLAAASAVDAVLRDNLHGLEIDERCCQIAAFALAFVAWTYPAAGGYRSLPELSIACTGIGPHCSADQWLKLAEQSDVSMPDDQREAIRNGLLNLHQLFSQAPTLGSLINPADLPSDLLTADYETIKPYLIAIRDAEKADDEIRERAVAAAGMVKAADLLASEYTLTVTNVPYLGRGKQSDLLRNHLEQHYDAGKADLATAFLLRCVDFCSTAGTAAIVAPQNWLFLSTYQHLRRTLLQEHTWNAVVRLGEHAFDSSAAAGAFAALLVMSLPPLTADAVMAGIDVSAQRGESPIYSQEKSARLKGDVATDIETTLQGALLSNPDDVIQFSMGHGLPLLGQFADTWQGIVTCDDNRFLRAWWEVGARDTKWKETQQPPQATNAYTGKSCVILWEDGRGSLHASKAHNFPPVAALSRKGVAVQRMSKMNVSLMDGEVFGDAVAPLIPKREPDLAAIWCYACSGELRKQVRKLDGQVKVAVGSLLKVPFDLAHWQKVAAEKYPDGLPEPESNDPTQWLFHGYPFEAEEDAMLQVSVARLIGHRWPAELEEQMCLSKRARALVKKCGDLVRFAENDGIVCIPAVHGEDPAAERLLKLLAACDIDPRVDLDDWLRNAFFEEHCRLFHDRPFVWHIWDGRKRDGFHALVNYHKLAEGGGRGQRLLENLTYAYLGDWITRQRDGVRRGDGGAEDRLAAAVELQKRLEAILAGEPPFDIFVRWKKISEQPIGWEPDINDGVRVNIRPFLASDPPNGRRGAGILRHKPNIKWTKDRGKEPQRRKDEYPWFWGWEENTEDFAGGKVFDGNRWNNCHYSTKVKQAARDAAMKGNR